MISIDVFAGRRRQWTDGEREELRQFAALGYDSPTIGRWLNRTASSVRSELSRLDLVRERPWTRPEEQRLLAARAAGQTQAAIARDLGRTEIAIRMRCRKLRARRAA